MTTLLVCNTCFPGLFSPGWCLQLKELVKLWEGKARRYCILIATCFTVNSVNGTILVHPRNSGNLQTTGWETKNGHGRNIRVTIAPTKIPTNRMVVGMSIRRLFAQQLTQRNGSLIYSACSLGKHSSSGPTGGLNYHPMTFDVWISTTDDERRRTIDAFPSTVVRLFFFLLILVTLPVAAVVETTISRTVRCPTDKQLITI